jgi:hypothetical protein
MKTSSRAGHRPQERHEFYDDTQGNIADVLLGIGVSTGLSVMAGVMIDFPATHPVFKGADDARSPHGGCRRSGESQ